MACVALPTCPLAMAEAERYLPTLITKVEKLMDGVGLGSQEVVMRMTGCPNGCSRPYVSEIGFVGRSLGFYDLHLGGDWTGRRLSKKYMEGIDEATILITLENLFRYVKQYVFEFLFIFLTPPALSDFSDYRLPLYGHVRRDYAQLRDAEERFGDFCMRHLKLEAFSC